MPLAEACHRLELLSLHGIQGITDRRAALLSSLCFFARDARGSKSSTDLTNILALRHAMEATLGQWHVF